MERAFRFAYLTWFSFAAKGEHFAAPSMANARIGKSHPVKRDLGALRELVQQAATRLGRVAIERRDFAECIRRYDAADSFFYLDPPYSDFQRNGRYSALGKERERELFDLLADAKAKFLLSFDDCAQVRRLSKERGFKLRRVDVTYTFGNHSNVKRAAEVIVANFALPMNVRRLAQPA